MKETLVQIWKNGGKKWGKSSCLDTGGRGNLFLMMGEKKKKEATAHKKKTFSRKRDGNVVQKKVKKIPAGEMAKTVRRGESV